MKKLIFLMCLITGFGETGAFGQVGDASVIMQRLYKSYDSIPSLTFDVKYTYSSDTLYGDYLHDEMMGSYTMSGRKAKFRLGGIEYLQNDSFFIAVYNDQKFILVSNARSYGGGYLPMRQAIDSILQVYSDHYRISVTQDGDSLGTIQFIGIDSLAMFSNFTVGYDDRSNMITSLQYDFVSPPQLFKVVEGDSTSVPISYADLKERNQKLRIDFINYRFDNFSDDLYDESNYVWMEDDEWKPIPKYREFRVFNTVTK